MRERPEGLFRACLACQARFMCGKFRYFASWADVHDFSEPLTARASNQPEEIAMPMASAPVLHLGTDGRRQACPMRWGFTNLRGGRRFPEHIHARNDRLLASPLWRPHFEARRGLLIVTSFNEGEEVPTFRPDRVTPTGNTRTRQWTIRPKDNTRLAIAVLFRDVPGSEPEFVMCTTEANEGISQFVTGDPDKRMAAVLDPDHIPTWLGETSSSPEQVQSILTPFEDHGSWQMAPEDTPAAARADPLQGSLF